jgi:PadR family transcriptional regulator PadR
MNSTSKNVQTKLAKGLLDLIILELLEKRPMHGYAIITTIHKQYGVNFGPSTIYPLLNILEKKNCLKGEWEATTDKPRKTYSLTNDGKKTLDFATGQLKAICRSMTMEDTPKNSGSQPQMQMAPYHPTFRSSQEDF